MSERRLFGTDGIRGKTNQEPITAKTALAIAMSASVQFSRGNHRHRVVIGKDTRLSGYMLEPALTAGFIAMGMDVILLGPIPTPGVAMMTRSLRADLGVMISASHNPFEDNGIKLFDPQGFKLLDSVELAIEEKIAEDLHAYYAAPHSLGRASRFEDAGGRYTEFVKNTFPSFQTLEGLKIVVDCAHGAAYRVAPEVLWELGANVVSINREPDGFNINKDCGAVYPEQAQKKVKAEQADLGITLDGDADRVLIIDHQGQIIDGDQIIALVAKKWLDDGRLKGKGVVSTVMSNGGLSKYLNQFGLNVVRTPVGDRYVVSKMIEQGYNVGGEPSGHIILTDYATTGDSLIATLQVLSVMVEKGQSVRELCRIFDSFPQRKRNIRYQEERSVQAINHPQVQKAVQEAHFRLGEHGRVVIRPSGTEKFIRVMVEGEREDVVEEILDQLIDVLTPKIL